MLPEIEKVALIAGHVMQLATAWVCQWAVHEQRSPRVAFYYAPKRRGWVIELIVPMANQEILKIEQVYTGFELSCKTIPAHHFADRFVSKLSQMPEQS